MKRVPSNLAKQIVALYLQRYRRESAVDRERHRAEVELLIDGFPEAIVKTARCSCRLARGKRQQLQILVVGISAALHKACPRRDAFVQWVSTVMMERVEVEAKRLAIRKYARRVRP